MAVLKSLSKTKTLNPEDFNELIQREYLRFQITKNVFSLLLVTNQKIKNNRFIPEISKDLLKVIRKPDVLGKLNDHTLAILLPATTKENAETFYQKIKTILIKHQAGIIIYDYPDHWFEDINCEINDKNSFETFNAINQQLKIS